MKSSLKKGRKIRMLRNALEVEKIARRTQFVEIDRAIPCILHANNRTAEKLLQQLLLVGLRSCQSKKDRDELIVKIERTINCDILGKIEFNELGQWRVPMEGDNLGDVKLSCPDANKLVGKVGLIVNVCVVNLQPQMQED